MLKQTKSLINKNKNKNNTPTLSDIWLSISIVSACSIARSVSNLTFTFSSSLAPSEVSVTKDIQYKNYVNKFWTAMYYTHNKVFILFKYTIYIAEQWNSTWNSNGVKRKVQKKEWRMEFFGFILQHCQHLRIYSADERWTGKIGHRQVMYYISIFLQGMRKTMKNLSQCS